MNRFFYSKFALKNIKTNKKLTLPYIISSVFSIAIFYILASLATSSNLDNIGTGAGATKQLLSYAMFVVGIFILIFMFYSYSFLIKNRISELGLYAVLGMTKKQIAKIVVAENIIIASITIFFGILVGVIFDKFAYLFLIKLMGAGVKLGFSISAKAIIITTIFFAGIYMLTVINSLIKVQRLNIIKMLKSNSVGEKEPKSRWLLSLIGVIFIGYGYYTSVTIETPVSALVNFFYAVVAVIIGTYLVFIAVSIFVLKILKNNKKFYYKTKNFISISNMIYRMKRNAVGLANICILSTMILVTLGSTTSLYFGKENLANTAYPRDVKIEALRYEASSFVDLQNNIDNILQKEGVTKKDVVAYRNIDSAAQKVDNGIVLQKYMSNLSNSVTVTIIPLTDYNKLYNTNITLKDDEILLKNARSEEKISQFKINNKQFNVKDETKIDNLQPNAQDITDSYYIIVKDIKTITDLTENNEEANDNQENDPLSQENRLDYYYAFNVDNSKNKAEIEKNIVNTVQEFNRQNTEKNMYVFSSSKSQETSGINEFMASFLFIGIFISLIFIVSQVMIMYYKQISEGYEDREKFEIMQKVGLDEVDIKKSIRSQILMIFFSPLLVATVHVTMAYPFIEKILKLFGLNNNSIFITTMIGTFVIFSIFYIIVYTITSKVYYNIIRYKN